MFQEVQIEVGHVMDVLEPLGLVRLAIAGVLGHEQVETARKLLPERHDCRRAARALQEEERPACAAAAQMRLAAVHFDEAVGERHAAFFFRTPDSSIAAGISAKFIGAITCAPATPGVSASWRRSSTQILRPSAFESAARSRRSTMLSGTMVPKSFSRIQRAERAEGIGAMPMRIGSLKPSSRSRAA